MHNLHIERSNVTPEILFLPASQRMEIAGECYPENPLPFFQPLLHTLQQYFEQQRPTPTPYPTATPTAWQPGETLSDAGDALGEILQGLGDLLIWLVVVVAPLAIPLVMVVLVVRRLRKKKA